MSKIILTNEESKLVYAIVFYYTIPPTRAIRVQDGASSALDGDLVTTNRKQRSSPFLVAPSGSTLEDYSGVISKHRQIESRTRRNSNVVQDSSGAFRLQFARREPEKVQLVARLTTAASGAGVIAGAGAATADAESDAVNAITDKRCILDRTKSLMMI